MDYNQLSGSKLFRSGENNYNPDKSENDLEDISYNFTKSNVTHDINKFQENTQGNEVDIQDDSFDVI